MRAVKASKLDVESRAEVRAQEELAALRRRSTWIGKQVQGFWKKAERVVNYKVGAAAKQNQETSGEVTGWQGCASQMAERLSPCRWNPAAACCQQPEAAIPVHADTRGLQRLELFGGF